MWVYTACFTLATVFLKLQYGNQFLDLKYAHVDIRIKFLAHWHLPYIIAKIDLRKESVCNPRPPVPLLLNIGFK